MTHRFRICAERKTPAGIATECLGITLHAVTAEAALANARVLFPGLKLVALVEES